MIPSCISKCWKGVSRLRPNILFTAWSFSDWWHDNNPFTVSSEPVRGGGGGGWCGFSASNCTTPLHQRHSLLNTMISFQCCGRNLRDRCSCFVLFLPEILTCLWGSYSRDFSLTLHKLMLHDFILTTSTKNVQTIHGAASYFLQVLIRLGVWSLTFFCYYTVQKLVCCCEIYHVNKNLEKLSNFPDPDDYMFYRKHVTYHSKNVPDS